MALGDQRENLLNSSSSWFNVNLMAVLIAFTKATGTATELDYCTFSGNHELSSTNTVKGNMCSVTCDSPFSILVPSYWHLYKHVWEIILVWAWRRPSCSALAESFAAPSQHSSTLCSPDVWWLPAPPESKIFGQRGHILSCSLPCLQFWAPVGQPYAFLKG